MSAGGPASRHFTLQELAPGVHAAIAIDGGWAVGNTGIIDLGDQTLVFDTTTNQHPARDLKSAAESLTGRPVSSVVLSHAHRDHVRGNQWFSGARIIATDGTRARMTEFQRERSAMIQREGLGPTRREFEEELRSILADPNESEADKLLWNGYLGGLMEDLDILQYTVPTESFATRLVLSGSKRTAEAITFGGGHTASDGLLFLPEERVAYLGDLLFIGYQPALSEGNPDELLRVLDKIEGLDAKILVPGHGPVGTPNDISTMRDYIAAVRRTAELVRTSGGGLAEARATPLPTRFRDWKFKRFYGWNLEYFLKNRLGSA